MAISSKTNYICIYQQDYHTLAKAALPDSKNE